MGKVLIDFDFERGMQRFAARSSLGREGFERVIWGQDWMRRYERGQVSTADYHQHLREAGRLDMDIEEFRATWSSVFLPDTLVSERLLAALKSRYPLILLSNTNEAHATFVLRQYGGILDHFDRKVFSHEVGAMKPDREIYEAAIAAAGMPPEALFFTDDRDENIEGAQRLGIHARKFVSEADLVADLKAHGVTV